MGSNHLYRSKDYALAEFVPFHMKDTNDLLELCDKTYYFTIAASSSNTNRVKERMRFTEHEKISKMAMGYDLNFD